MNEEIITQALEPIDERLPYKQFIAKAQKQANDLPLEITENGIVYELFDCKMEIKGYMNGGIVYYRKKEKQ